MKLQDGLEISSHLFENSVTSEIAMDLFKRYVKFVHLEIFSYCNRRCSYCPVSKVDRISKNTKMSDTVFNRIIEDLKSIDYEGHVNYNIYNEPMADPILYKRLSQTREALEKATLYFNTNGDYLNAESLERLVDNGVSYITVTIHPGGGTPYQDLEVLSRFTELSSRIGRRINITRHKTNQVVFGEFNYKGLQVNVMAQNYLEVGVNRAGSVEAGPKIVRKPPCRRPFTDFTIYHDGSVFPCCQFFPDLGTHDEYRVDYVQPDKPIFSIFTRELMASFRRDLFDFSVKKSPCDECSEGLGVPLSEAVPRQEMLEALIRGENVKVESIKEGNICWSSSPILST